MTIIIIKCSVILIYFCRPCDVRNFDQEHRIRCNDIRYSDHQLLVRATHVLPQEPSRKSGGKYCKLPYLISTPAKPLQYLWYRKRPSSEFPVCRSFSDQLIPSQSLLHSLHDALVTHKIVDQASINFLSNVINLWFRSSAVRIIYAWIDIIY